MPIELSELMKLAMNKRPSLFVGELPRPVASYLKCNPGVVYLGHREFLKIQNKHPEIETEEFQSLHLIVKDGMYLPDLKRPSCVTIFWKDPEIPLPYLVGLKAADAGGEVWVSTFHRTNQTQIDSRCRRDGILLKGKK